MKKKNHGGQSGQIIFEMEPYIKPLATESRKKAKPSQVEIIERHAKDAVAHFRTDGWNLNYAILLDELSTDLIGYNPEWILLEEITKELSVQVSRKANNLGITDLMLEMLKDKKAKPKKKASAKTTKTTKKKPATKTAKKKTADKSKKKTSKGSLK
jgi:hypothetical protein